MALNQTLRRFSPNVVNVARNVLQATLLAQKMEEDCGTGSSTNSAKQKSWLGLRKKK